MTGREMTRTIPEPGTTTATIDRPDARMHACGILDRQSFYESPMPISQATGDPTKGTITKRHPMAWHSPVTFKEASDQVIPFGSYAGQTIDDIARTDRGLLWLQWLYDDRLEKLEGTTRIPSANERYTNGCLHVYLTDETIAREVIAARNK